ncbi:hypothetical protein ACRAQ7_03670 [Erythrobacter sp. W53]|uniref:hypothetical protein n=1 Tax=Erythrobacter sp. W53 TaxID=3425947 RepID=UPI003D7678F1
MGSILRLILTALALVWTVPAAADVQLSFHSFNGSVLFGRYPHTFIVLDGTLEASGKVIKENYGFSAKRATPAVLQGPVKHTILVEKDKWLTKTNRHFTVSLSDDQYHRIKALVEEWRNAPGKFYDLDTRNCIHFVGEIAKIVGLKVTYPQKMLRRPKKWLNHITGLNPQLGAKVIK